MIAWFARNGVAANLVMLIIVVGGLVSLYTIKVELFPPFSLDAITVTVPFRGAAPEEVEENICLRIEEKIQDLEGIKRLRSSAREGVGVVTAEIEKGYDSRRLLSDIKARVDTIDTFPIDAETPIVEEVMIRREVLAVVLSGPFSESELKEFAEKVRLELISIPGITQVDIRGVRDYEISIEVSEDALRRHQLTFDEVAAAVRNSSIDLPGGSIRSEGGEILLRTKGQAYRGAEFADIVLITRPDGTHIRIGDVATVVDGFTDTVTEMNFGGQKSVELMVYEVGRQSPLDISAKVERYVEAKQSELPPGIGITIWRDVSFYLWDRLNMLINNGLIGLLLVLTVLTLFLRPSLAFWVTLGIPFSFLGTFLVMPWMDISINLVSLFALILVLGIVVDDAIVVGESVFSEFQRSGPTLDASIRGTLAVSMPVTFSVLTTAVAFTPLLALPGFEGKFLAGIPLVVIPTLLFSLLQCKLVLPYHLSLCHVGQRKVQDLNFLQIMQRKVANSMEVFVERYYRPVLRLALNHRYTTSAGFTAIFMVTLGLLAGGHIKTVPFPPVPSDYIGVTLTYPEGTPENVTRAGLDRVLQALNNIVEKSMESGRPNPVEHLSSAVGLQSFGGGPHGSNITYDQTHIGEIIVELRKAEYRENEDSAVYLSNRWREELGELPGVRELSFIATAAGGQGEPIDVQFSGGKSLEDLRTVANHLKARLATYEGVFDIRDNLADSQQEIQLSIRPEAEVLGLTQADLGRQVRQAFFGEEAQRFQRGRDDVRVMVRYPREERLSVGNLEELRIRTPQGQQVAFGEVADVNVGLGYATINRMNRQRIVNVYADVDKENTDLQAIKRHLESEVLPEILADFPDIRYTLEGEAREIAEGNEALLVSSILAAFAMYALLAIPLRSYLQPLIVMAVIPFGIVGALWGHMIMGHPVSRLSNFGIIALAGVVVNNSLIMVVYINEQRQAGLSLLEAAWESGAVRFRPIVLTSLTTFVGLVPLLFERSLQAQFMIPMAISLSFGVLFATFLTLFLVPAIYLALEDVKALFRRLLFRSDDGGAR